MARPSTFAAFALVMIVTWSTARAQDESSAGDQLPDSEMRQYKDWAVECRRPGEGEQNCAMFQRQVLQNGRTVLLMSVQRVTADAEPLVILQLPLGVLLRPGVAITVVDGESRTLAYRLCNNNGCMVTFPLDDELKTAFSKGQTARVEMTTGDGKPLRVEVSLLGFSAALSTL